MKLLCLPLLLAQLYCVKLHLVQANCLYGDLEKDHALKIRDFEKNSANCRSNIGAKEGCTVRLRCEQASLHNEIGYYLHGDNTGQGVDVQCKKGSWIVSQTGKDTPKCLPGCPVLTSGDMQNATYYGNTEPKTAYRNGAQSYWPIGTVIKTQCKPGYIFSHPAHEKEGIDNHRCTGTIGSGWLDVINSKDYGWPGICRAVCEPFDLRDVHSSVIIVANPSDDKSSVRTINGKNVIITGVSYRFGCAKNYKYPPPHDILGSQTLTCIGGADGWYDPDHQKSYKYPAQCLPEGCTALTSSNIDTKADIIVSAKCSPFSGIMKEGCEVEIRCKKSVGNKGLGYYMNNMVNGQKLICKKNKWYSVNDGSEVVRSSDGIYGARCETGCLRPKSSELTTTLITMEESISYRNVDTIIYPRGSMLVTSCKPGNVRPNVPNQDDDKYMYVCESTGWSNADKLLNGNGNGMPTSCVPACLVPCQVEGTVLSFDSAKLITKNNLTYLPINSVIDVKCSPKFSPPMGSSHDLQSLICVGGSQGWKNIVTELKNEQIMTCVRDGASGCELVSAQSYPNVEITRSQDCKEIDGLLSKNCTLRLKCKNGYIPTRGLGTVDSNGVQKLVCKAELDGYVDETNANKKNIEPLKCEPACIFLKNITTATYIQIPQQLVKYAGSEYIVSGTSVSVTCETPHYEVNNAVDYTVKGPILYKCMGGSERYLKPSAYMYNTMPGDACGPVCEALEVANEKGTVLDPQYNLNSLVIMRNNKQYVVNMLYHIQCSNGYEFPKGSVEAQTGIQKLQCFGLEKGYVDIINGKQNAKVMQCVRSAQPRCPVINYEQTNTVILSSDGDCKGNHTLSSSCQLVIGCKTDTYPSAGFRISQASTAQLLKCVEKENNQMVWEDVNNIKNEVLKCEFGCRVPVENEHVDILNQPQPVTIGSLKYFKTGTAIQARCSEGRYPNLRSGLLRTENNGFTYLCTNLIPGMPWQNVVTQRFEEYPGSICGLPCKALQLDDTGLEIISRPEEFGLTERLVVGDSIYHLQCKPGFNYSPNCPYYEKKTQTLLCNPTTGKYIDISNGNKSTVVAEPCIREEGSGCPDFSIRHADINTTNCKSGFKKGCKVKIQCKEGYIPLRSEYHLTGYQELTCPDGFEWTDSNGKTVKNIIQCEPACRVDSKMLNEYASVISKYPTISVKNETYIEAEEYISIKCKGENVIWENNFEKTGEEHIFVCQGGDLKFRRIEDHKVNVLLGEGCVKTCSKLKLPSSFSSLNLTVLTPKTIVYQEKELVYNNDEYIFSCLQDFVYPSHCNTDSEKFKCNSKSGTYQNTVTGEIFKIPTGCIRNPYLNECQKIEQDSSRVIETSSGCQTVNGNFYKSGCKISLKCKPKNMPSSPDYFTQSGEQEITCGFGGSGWRDQFGNIVVEEMKCIPGCKPFDNHYDQIHVKEKIFNVNGLKIVCKEIDVTTNPSDSILHPYYCSSNTSKDSEVKCKCSNACHQIVSLPFGVEIYKEPNPAQLEPGLPYIAGNSQYVFRCRTGFTYAATTVYRSLGRQTLQCNPTTNAYDDTDSKVRGASIQACEEAKGCLQMQPSSNLIESGSSPGCTKNGHFVNDGCTLKYECASGFYPSDTFALYNGVQVAKCSESKQLWLDYELQPLSLLTSCLKGCASFNLTQLVTLEQSKLPQIITDVFTDAYGKSYQCYSKRARDYLIQKLRLIETVSKTYFCDFGGSNNNQSVITGGNRNFCQDACPLIDLNQLPEGVKIKETPNTFNPYGSEQYLGKGSKIMFRCADDYEYPATTVYNKKGYQEFLCSDNLVYMDTLLKKYSDFIQRCQKKPGALAPVGDNVCREVDNACKVSAGLYNVGCKMTLKCNEGAYPSSPMYQNTPYQQLELIMDPFLGTIWVDSVTKQRVAFLSCQTGCLPITALSKNRTSSTLVLNYMGTIVNCSEYSEETTWGSLPAGVEKFYCDHDKRNNTANTVVLPCTNVCSLPAYESSLSVRVGFPLASPFSHYIVRGTLVSVTCATGKRWRRTDQATKRYYCNQEGKIIEYQSSNSEIVHFIKDDCA